MRIIVIAVLIFLTSLGIKASPTVGEVVSEWKVPYEHSRPRDPFVDSHGAGLVLRTDWGLSGLPGTRIWKL